MYSIVLNQEAEEELEQIVNYYVERAGIPVAEKFYEDLQNAYHALEVNPFYQVRTKHYRAFPLQKFPFLLFFEIDQERKLVKIISIFNTSQDPKKWP